MAMLALPLAFMLGGYALGGSVGAAVGLLIGGWLFGPKSDEENKIFDPGAEEMPRFNQSLRGATMPVLFGTNRVASNIVWVKNFQTVRSNNASGDGGKFGGSGMSSKVPSGPKQVSYQYKWDMMYHLGMVHEPFSLFRGWAGGQRLTIDTISRIIANTSGVSQVYNTIGANPDAALIAKMGPQFAQQQAGAIANAAAEDNQVKLDFDDAFFSPGDPTGAASPNEWAYWQAQEGVGSRFPHTSFIGFQALDLGTSAVVPQLTWEVGPPGEEFESDPLFLSQVTPETVGSVYDTPIIVGENGKHYQPMVSNDEDSHQTLWNIDDDTTVNVPTSLADTDLIGGAVLYSRLFPIPDTAYFYLAVGRPSGPVVETALLLCKINSSGAVTLVRETYEGAGSVDYALSALAIHACGLFVSDTFTPNVLTALPVYVVSNGTTQYVLYLPSIEGQHLGDGFGDPGWDTRFQELAGFGDGFYNAATERKTGYVRRFFFLTKYELGELGAPVNDLIVCAYVGKAEIENATHPTITAYSGTYPNGFVIAQRVTGFGAEGAIEGVEVLNSSFRDADGNAAIPFTDDALDLDGSTENFFASYQNPIVQYVEDFKTWILIWPKTFEATADLSPTGSKMKLVVQVWYPDEGLAKFHAHQTGSWFDTVSDAGAIEANRYTSVPRNVQAYVDFDKGGLIGVSGIFFGADSIGTNLIASIFGTLRIGTGSDVYPPFVIKSILTNTVYGLGIPESVIDTTTYDAAQAFCLANGYEISVQYVREESALGAIEELLAIYGGYLIVSGGKIKFGIVQATDADNPVRTIDNDHLVPMKEGDPPVRITDPARQDGFNKIRVNYLDRNLDYRQNQVEVGDEVDQDLNGVRFREFPPKFVMRYDTAQKIAERALWTNLYGRKTYDFTLGWKDADLEPGDVITLVDSFHDELSTGKKVRITRWAEKKRGEFSVMAIDENPVYISAAHYLFIVSSFSDGKGLQGELTPNYQNRMYELPRTMQGANAQLYVGYNQSAHIRGCFLYLSPDGVTYSPQGNVEPYNISGIFAAPLLARPPGHVETDVVMYLMPSSPFSASSPTYVSTLAIDDPTEQLRAVGGSVLIAGSEALAVEGVTLLAQNKYRVSKLYRGWGGTLAHAHSSGEYWHKHGAGIFAREITEDQVGTLVYYKVVPYNFNGEIVDIASIDARTYQIQGGFWKPRALGELKVFVQSPIVGTNSDEVLGPHKAVTSGGCDAHFDWPDSSRLSGFGAGGYGSQPYGQSVADSDAHKWRVEVLSTNAHVVRSLSVNSGPWTYDRAVHSADFNGFAQEFAVRVTPYNDAFGDAPYGATRSLNLFW